MVENRRGVNHGGHGERGERGFFPPCILCPLWFFLNFGITGQGYTSGVTTRDISLFWGVAEDREAGWSVGGRGKKVGGVPPKLWKARPPPAYV